MKWYELDYNGWEKVNYDQMIWKFDLGDEFDIDERKIKRVDAKLWLIEDDQGNFQEFDYYDINTLFLLESYYQDWLRDNKGGDNAK